MGELKMASCDLKNHSCYNLKTAHATSTRVTRNDVLIIYQLLGLT